MWLAQRRILSVFLAAVAVVPAAVKKKEKKKKKKKKRKMSGKKDAGIGVSDFLSVTAAAAAM